MTFSNKWRHAADEDEHYVYAIALMIDEATVVALATTDRRLYRAPPAKATREKNGLARDEGLEELLREDLRMAPGLLEKAMFGGQAWLLNGNLLCGARDDGMLARLGKDRDGWALEMPDVVPMISRGQRMQGWVRAGRGSLRR